MSTLSDFILVETEIIGECRVPSKSKPGIFYSVIAYSDGSYTCNCPARMVRGMCRHIKGFALMVEGVELNTDISEPYIKGGSYRPIIDMLTNARLSNSKIAWSKLQDSIGEAQGVIFNAILRNPGITRQALVKITGRPINSVSGRVNDLIRMELVSEGESVINGLTGMPNATLWACDMIEPDDISIKE